MSENRWRRRRRRRKTGPRVSKTVKPSPPPSSSSDSESETIEKKEKKLNKLKMRQKNLKKEIDDLKKNKLKKNLSQFESKYLERKYRNKSDSYLIRIIMSKTQVFDEDSLSVFCREDLLELLLELRDKGGRPKKQKEENQEISVKNLKEINLKGFLKWKDTVNFDNLGVNYKGWKFQTYKKIYK